MVVEATESALWRFEGVDVDSHAGVGYHPIRTRYGGCAAGGRRLPCERGIVGGDASVACLRGAAGVRAFLGWGSIRGGVPMITLNMRLTAKRGREDDLLRAVRDRWMEAMSRQPGFVRGVLLEPYSGTAAAKVGLSEKEFTFEVVSFWETEEDRAAWAASEIHAEVIAGVNDAVEPDGGKDSALFTVKYRWGEE